MLHIEKWKVVLVIILSVLGILYAAPNLTSPATKLWLKNNMPSALPSKTINLGLDLQGGSYILLEADTKVIINDRLDSMVDAARSAMRSEHIGYINLAKKRDGISFKLRKPSQDRSAAYKIAKSLEEKSDVLVGDDGQVDVILGTQALKAINAHVINQSIEIIRRRVDETGTKEPMIQRQGDKRIVVQLPGIDDPQHVKDLIGKTAKMGFHLVDTNAVGRKIPLGSRKLPMREDKGQFVIVKKRAIITGEMLIDSQPTFEKGSPVVSFKFNSIGAKKFCKVTRKNVGRPFAIVLDGEVISDPVIRDAICGGSGIISGNFSVKEAHDLSLLLRAGALPAPLNVVEERSVGPTLGSDSVESGKVAALISIGLIFIFMFASYGLFGIFANIALFFNIVFIFALLSILQATLTLPGIAGIILTIGMAVDANVLIYERIKEELRKGRTVIKAVDAGYKMAFATIIDANLTTLIVAVILFSFGSGPIKGFAVTMSIGIITSLFSAIMITRLIIIKWLRVKKPKSLNI